jgi:hypothetical protein
MKYMILIYADPALEPVYGTPEFGAMMGGYAALNQTLRSDGVYVSGDALKNVDSATSVRKRNGQVETMDGPFAETKERLGGFYIVDCENLDAALKYAAMVPAVDHGTIEVRPLMEINL